MTHVLVNSATPVHTQAAIIEPSGLLKKEHTELEGKYGGNDRVAIGGEGKGRDLIKIHYIYMHEILR